MSEVRADLHLHTVHSDGKYTSSEVVDRAWTAGISVLAITDHDTVDGVAEAQTACQSKGMEFVVGAEISAESRGAEVHLLAYGFNPASDVLLALLEKQKEHRRDRLRSFLGLLREAGVDLGPDDEIDQALDGSVGRPHLANLIVAAGAADSMEEAFARFLVPGSKTFVKKAFPPSKKVIETVHIAKGYCVVAHPGNYTSNNVITELLDAGLDGIEVFHPSHDQTLQDYYQSVADTHGLFVTGGSDFHGWREHDERNLGSYFVSWPLPGNILDRRTLNDAPAF